MSTVSRFGLAIVLQPWRFESSVISLRRWHDPPQMWCLTTRYGYLNNGNICEDGWRCFNSTYCPDKKKTHFFPLTLPDIIYIILGRFTSPLGSLSSCLASKLPSSSQPFQVVESVLWCLSVLYKPSVFTANPFYASPSQKPQRDPVDLARGWSHD